MLLRYSDRACHAWITHGVIVEHASLSKSELICCALINRAAIKHTRCIGRDRMCGGVIVRPADRGAYLDHQRIGLKASTGDRHGIVGTSRSCSRGNYSPIRRGVLGEGGVCVALICLVGAPGVPEDDFLPPNKLPSPV